MARQVDPEGRRTIGAFTFGGLEAGAADAVVKALHGSHALWHGRLVAVLLLGWVAQQHAQAAPSPGLQTMLTNIEPLSSCLAGVLTKLDIMDRGTDAVAVLKNETVPLALGFVGVVLRR